MEKFSGANFCFWVSVLVLCVFGAVLPMFLLYYLLFRSRNCLEKILLMSGLVFLGCLLSSFGCFADVVVFFVFFFFFFQRDSSGSNRAHPHTHFVFLFPFLFCVPAAFVCSCPFWPCVLSSLAFCRGAILGPGRFWDSPWTLLRPFSRDARRQGCFSASCALFCFSPFRSVLRPHTFSRSPSRLSSRSGQPRVGFLSRKGHNIGWSRPPLARVRARGSASRAEGWSPPVSGFLTASFGSHRVTGTPWAFLIRGGGAFSAPSQALFHTHLSFVSPPQVFFFFGLEALGCPAWIARRYRIQLDAPRMHEFRALLRELPRNYVRIPPP